MRTILIMLIMVALCFGETPLNYKVKNFLGTTMTSPTLNNSILDRELHSVRTIGTYHSAIHNCEAFSISQCSLSLADDGELAVEFIVPSSDSVEIHLKTMIASGGASPFELFIVEGPTFTTSDEFLVGRNRKRNCTNVSLVKTGVNPSSWSAGDTLEHIIIDGGSGPASTDFATSVPREVEWVLAPGDTTIVVLRNISSGSASSNLEIFWYEE